MSNNEPLTNLEALMIVSESIMLLEHVKQRIEFAQKSLGDESPPEFRMATIYIGITCDHLQTGVVYTDTRLQGSTSEGEDQCPDQQS